MAKKKTPALLTLHLSHFSKAAILTLFTLLVYIVYHSIATLQIPSLLYIPDAGRSSQRIALQRQGVALNLLDYRLFKRYGSLSPGWVRFSSGTKLTPKAFLRALKSKTREKTRRIVMYGGMTLEDFAAKTAKQTKLSAKKIIASYHHFSPYHDGGILAGYYYIPYRATATAISYYTTYKSEETFKHLAATTQHTYDPKQWKQILTIASIIQKETQNSREMPLIASVIYNRLEKDMKLQLDATLNYDQFSHTIVTPERIKKDKSRYNTYHHKGLPPHPLGSAGRDAILAALKPAKTDYLYFMLAQNGTHNFAATYPEHLTHIRWYNHQKEKNPRETNQSKNSTNQQLDTIPQHKIKVQK